MKKLLIAISCLLMSACETLAPETAFEMKPEKEKQEIMKKRGQQAIALYGPQCDGMGFKRDTPEFSQCVLSLNEQKRKTTCRQSVTGDVVCSPH